jgi:hypothetical protein
LCTHPTTNPHPAGTVGVRCAHSDAAGATGERILATHQLYRIALEPTTWLVVLTIFDAFVIWLTWREWRRQHGHAAPG